MIDWKVLNIIFKIGCVIFTLVLVADWIEIYLMNEDMTVIENSSYYKTKSDVFPVMSLCFNQQFRYDRYFKTAHRNIIAENYDKYLIGQYFESGMNEVNYEDLSTNISDYLIAYDVWFTNGSSVLDTRSNLAWKAPYVSYSWNSWWKYLLKCYAFELTDPSVYSLLIYFHRDIFPNRIRPQTGGFAVMFHYPNQITDSLRSVTRQWTTRENTSNYWMDFNVRGMNVRVHRVKNGPDDCVQNFGNFDNVTIERHIKSVGCKTPYQKTGTYWPLCNTTEMMRKAEVPIHRLTVRPCREIETIDYQHVESEADTKERQVQTLQGKDWDKWFCVVWRFLNNRFTKTVNIRKIDINSLIGYVGGYIGICTGIALAQVPEILVTVAICTKEVLEGLNRKITHYRIHETIKGDEVNVNNC